MIVNNELERMWKERVVVRSRHIRGVTEETTRVDEDLTSKQWLALRLRPV